MKTYKANIIRIARSLFVTMLAVASLTSCDGAIYDGEGDCDVTYRLRFRYDMNMKYADAFPHEVKSVHVYAFNTDGRLVWQAIDSGEKLSQEGYEIILPLEAGDYKLMAWCGLDNGESFFVQDISEGDTRDPLHCKMNRNEHPEDGIVSTDDLHPLFHGAMEVNLPESIDGADFTYTMPLTKDTNVVRIVLQHLSGQDINADDFTFKIEDNNGWLHHDNSLLDDDKITYHAWSKYSGSAGVDTRAVFAARQAVDAESVFGRHLLAGAAEAEAYASRAITDVKVAVAELTVSRLVQRDWTTNTKPMLTIRRAADQGIVARIPFIDYALLVKGNYNRDMSDQEYLDRQDEYNMTFFLDESNHWLAAVIYINSWRVVLDNIEFD